MTVHRKLIRPSIKDVKDSTGQSQDIPPQGVSSPSQNQPLVTTRRKQIPAEQTNAESFYYLKQMQTKTPMVIILQDGEQVRGYIEWYDRHCLKVNRHKEPNLMLMKQCVKYMYKQEDEVKTHRRRKRPQPDSDAESKAPEKKSESVEEPPHH